MHVRSSSVMISDFFIKIQLMFFGYFDPITIFLDNKNKYDFWGEISDISAKTATLVILSNNVDAYLTSELRSVSHSISYSARYKCSV